jgi:lipopolysaccharide assembly outer membrane protein LptD (OstA)
VIFRPLKTAIALAIIAGGSFVFCKADSPSAPQTDQPGVSGAPQSPKGDKGKKATQDSSDRSTGKKVSLENADDVFIDDDDIATATGHVRINYDQYHVECDKAIIDMHSRQCWFTGHIVFENKAHTLNIRSDDPGGGLNIDLRSGIYSFHGHAHGQISPSLLSATGLIHPLYFSGESVKGDSFFIDTRLSLLTTCDFDTPHYWFLAKTARIIPEKRLIAKHVTLYRAGKKLITINNLVLPLDNRSLQYFPQFGVSSNEGYYLKLGIPYALTGTALGVLRLDMMQKKGIGTGIDQDYQPPFGNSQSSPNSGVLKLYQLHDDSTGDQELLASIAQSQTIAGGIQIHVDSQYQNNAYQESGYSTLSTTNSLTVNRTTSAESTAYSLNVQGSQYYGSSSSQNTTQSLTQKWNTAHSGAATIKLSLTGYTVGGNGTSSNSQTLGSDTSYFMSTGGYKWGVDVTSYSVLRNTTGASTMTTTQKLPELSIAADPASKQGILKTLPLLSAASLTIGDYDDPSADIRTDRAQLILSSTRSNSKKDALTTGYTTGFEQDFYGDDTAKYNLLGQYSSQYAFSSKSYVSATYKYLRQYGYTPFYFDAITGYNDASFGVNYQLSKHFQTAVTTGFDFTQTKEYYGIPAEPWQNLSAQLIWKPDDFVTNKISPVYNLNTGELNDLTNTLALTSRWGYSFASTQHYVPSDHTISSITSSLTLPIITDKNENAGYKVELLEGYNGYTNQVTYYGAELTKSWHDYELSMIVQNGLSSGSTGTTFFLNMSLRAFPSYEPFGIGKLGEGVSTGSGTVL